MKRVLDVGCGDGHWLLASAAARPDVEHLGIDILPAPIERAAREAERRGLKNLRFLAGDAVAWLKKAAIDSLDEIHVYHPQPYVDPAVVHLGMLTPAFFERAWRVLRRNGLLVLQTDEKRYGKYLLAAVEKHFAPEVLKGPWPDAPEGRTRREVVGRRKGMKILRISARRRKVPLTIDVPPPYFDRPGVRRRRVTSRRAKPASP